MKRPPAGRKGSENRHFPSGKAKCFGEEDKMTEIINLNKIRKTKLKQQKKMQSQENRVIHGLSSKLRKAEKEKHKRQQETLDGKRRDPAEDNKKG